MAKATSDYEHTGETGREIFAGNCIREENLEYRVLEWSETLKAFGYSQTEISRALIFSGGYCALTLADEGEREACFGGLEQLMSEFRRALHEVNFLP